MEETLTPLTNLEDWKVGALRFTAFADPLASATERLKAKNWEATVGTPPENVSSRDFGSVVLESGVSSSGGKLTFRKSPSGFEWFLESIGDANRPESALWMEWAVFRPFVDLIPKWLADAPAFRRLAFGAALYQPMSKDKGHPLLSRLLRISIDPKAGDFIYQINRRRPSESVKGLEINRINKWSWLRFEIRASPDVPAPGPEACLLELDINTPPEFTGNLPKELYVPLFRELVTLGTQIAVFGDIP